MKNALLSLSIASLLFTAPATMALGPGDHGGHTDYKMEQLPAPVQEGIRKIAGDVIPFHIFDGHTRSGMKYYIVEFKKDDRDHDAAFGTDGKLLKHEIEQKLEDLSETVRNVIVEKSGKVESLDIEKVMVNDRVRFEAEWHVDGKSHSLHVDPEGNVLKHDVKDQPTPQGE